MAKPSALLRLLPTPQKMLCRSSPALYRQAIIRRPTSVRYSSQVQSHPSDLLSLELDHPTQIVGITARLKENEYASTYERPDDKLPPEEGCKRKEVKLDNLRAVFRLDGVLLFRGEQEDVISYQRLRDSCRCAQCIDPSTRQKLRSSGSVSTIKLSKAFQGFDSAGTKGTHITWSDSHSSFYSEELLREMIIYSEAKTNVNHHFKRRFWDKEVLLKSPSLRMTYDDVQTPDSLLAMLRQAQVYGLVVISGVPTERTSDKDCELRAFMNRIGEIRDTFYGQTWDVKSVVHSKNVAYTTQDLGFHMDLLYFTSPPRFQALHCLRNRAEGGSSYFADAFHAGRHIQHTDPATTTALARYPLDFEYDNDGHYLRCRHFVMNQLDSLRAHINWSPPFQGMIRRVANQRAPVKEALRMEKELYKALAKFEASLQRPGVQYEFTMKEGDLVFFDNRRVLHARRAFGAGERWLKGCYLDGDVLWDKLVTMQS